MVQAAQLSRRRVLTLLVGGLLAAGCAGGDDLSAPQVDAALEAIDPGRIAAHMHHLADDALQGRGTGTPGYLMAAEYVARQFEELGLQPAGENGGFYQQVPLAGADLVREQSSIALVRDGSREVLEPDVDYVMAGDFTRQRAELDAGAVFVGYGISAPEIGHDDYAGVDVRGKIVVMFRGAPQSFTNAPRALHASSRLKQRNAVDRGAVGVIRLLKPEDRKRRPWDRIVSHSKMTAMRWLDAAGRPHDSFPELFVSATLSAEGERRLFGSAAHDPEPDGQVAVELPVRLEVRTASRHSRLESPNVAAVFPGSDPALREEFVVLTAHLDHLGVGAPVDGDRIHNGAYDNASGIAILLEIARALTSLDEPPKRSLLFLAVTGEERGLLGSDYFVGHPTVAADRIVANLNLDMVLMLHPLHDLVVFGLEHSTLAGPVRRAASRLDLELSPDPVPEEVLFIRSDQFPFVRRGIPALFMVSGLETGDPQVDGRAQWLAWMREVYHTPRDDMSQPIDFEAGATFARVNFLVSYLVANDSRRPAWNPDDFFGERFGPP